MSVGFHRSQPGRDPATPRFSVWPGWAFANTPGLPSRSHWIVSDGGSNAPPRFFAERDDAGREAARRNHGETTGADRCGGAA